MKITCRFILTAWLITATALAGDLTITFATKGKAFGFSSNSTETHFYSSKFQRVRSEDGKVDHLFDYEKGISYTIDHKKKVIQMMKMEDVLQAMEQMHTQAPEGMGAVMGAMFGKADEVRVDDTGAEVVAGHTCAKYRISAGKLVMDVSADPKLKPPVSPAMWARATKLKAAIAGRGPMLAAFKKLYEELGKIEGIPLKTAMKGFMGSDTLSEATKVAEGPIPPATFDLPANYKTEDLGKQLKEEMAKGK